MSKWTKWKPGKCLNTCEILIIVIQRGFLCFIFLLRKLVVYEKYFGKYATLFLRGFSVNYDRVSLMFQFFWGLKLFFGECLSRRFSCYQTVESTSKMSRFYNISCIWFSVSVSFRVINTYFCLHLCTCFASMQMQNFVSPNAVLLVMAIRAQNWNPESVLYIKSNLSSWINYVSMSLLARFSTSVNVSASSHFFVFSNDVLYFFVKWYFVIC